MRDEVLRAHNVEFHHKGGRRRRGGLRAKREEGIESGEEVVQASKEGVESLVV